MKQFIKSKINTLYLIVLTILTFLVVFIYIQFDNKQIQIRNNIINLEIVQTSKFAQNIAINIQEEIKKDIYKELRENISLRDRIEGKLALFLNSKYKNLFIIRKDEKNQLRYLLDAELKESDRVEFNQKFRPHMGAIWKKVFEQGVAQYTIQDDISDLWITFLYPIVIDENLQAIIVFDFSSTQQEELVKVLTPLKNFFLYLSILMLFMLIVSFSQFYIQVWSKKRTLIDPLTHAYNRYFLEEIKNKINLNDYEVCIIDIDHFKKINDTFGHAAGDEVLRSFSKRIQNQIKDNDIFIRLGGEEFLLLLYKRNNKGTCKVPERLRELIEKGPIGIDDKVINLTASFGINNQPHLSMSLKDAIRIADEQLYIAKDTGRNKVVYSYPC